MHTFLTDPWITLVWVAGSVVAAYAAVIVYTRIAGLRSFAKLSAFDFAATIAIGSMMASMAVLDSVSILRGGLALGVLYLLQTLVALARRSSGRIERALDNRPLVLMHRGTLLEENMRRGRITAHELRSELRRAGICHRDQVRLVLLETTGDISVLGDEPEPWLLEDVAGLPDSAG